MTKTFVLIFTYCLLLSCNGYRTANKKKGDRNADRVCESIYGEEYLTLGNIRPNKKDSLEEGLWQLTNKSNPLVLFGNYTNGILCGEWKFVLENNQMFSSTWSAYSNDAIRCKFSLPFPCNDTLVNKHLLKLSTINDSLGRVSIIVGISDTSIKDHFPAQWDPKLGIHVT